MIVQIQWNEIYNLWSNELWPNRKSPIEECSAMQFLGGYSMENMRFNPTFHGYFVRNVLVGVNSGHMCDGCGYRSRGLYVNPEFRGEGIGTKLLMETIDYGFNSGADFVWSLPRQTSWKTYEHAGFKLASGWFETETSYLNAYCVIYKNDIPN